MVVWRCLTPPSNIGKGQGTSASMTWAIGISKLCNNCINVVGGMHIIIHVQQWLNYTESSLGLGCSDTIPRTSM